MKSHCIVISRYNENLDWVQSLVDTESWITHIIVYNKGLPNISFSGKALEKIQILEIPNEGREGETYLRYIIDNYDTLPEHVWFLQGDPFDHSPDFMELMKESVVQEYVHKEFQILSWRYNAMIPPNIEYDKRYYIQNNRINQYYIDTHTQQTVEVHEFYDFMRETKVNSLKSIHLFRMIHIFITCVEQVIYLYLFK